VGEGCCCERFGAFPEDPPQWFVILGLATVSLSSSTAHASAGRPRSRLWLMAAPPPCCCSFGAAPPELGHSLWAMAYGVKVRSITLFLLGRCRHGGAGCSTALVSPQVAGRRSPCRWCWLGPAAGAACRCSHAGPWRLSGARSGVLNLGAGAFNLPAGLRPRWRLDRQALVLGNSRQPSAVIQVAAGIGRFPVADGDRHGHAFVLRGGGFGAFWLILPGLVRPWGFAQPTSALSLGRAMARNSKWETRARPLSGAGNSCDSLAETSAACASATHFLPPADWVSDLRPGGDWQG